MDIFVDFEMQEMRNAKKAVRKIWYREIIEIGATALNDKGKVQGSFKMYVKPQYSKKISPKITDLTGISTNEVSGAAGFNEAIHTFMGWCIMQENPVVYAWSESDLTQLKNECGLKHVELSEKELMILSGWHDFQKEFGDLIHAEDPVGLEKAVNLCGLQPVGRLHDAYWDSLNTARVFRSTRNKERFLDSVARMKEILGYEEKRTTLGELVDFSSISLSA